MHVAAYVETGVWTSGKRHASAGKLEQREDPKKHTPGKTHSVENDKQLQSK